MIAVLAFGRDVRRDIGAAHQLIRIAPMIRTNGDADRCPHRHAFRLGVERILQRGENPNRGQHSLRAVGEPGQNHAEFLIRQPRVTVRGAQDLRNANVDLPQRRFPCRHSRDGLELLRA